MTTSAAVFQAMAPFCVYRPSDISEETGIKVDDVRRHLRSLSRGGVVRRDKDGRRTLYQTKQCSLFDKTDRP